MHSKRLDPNWLLRTLASTCAAATTCALIVAGPVPAGAATTPSHPAGGSAGLLGDATAAGNHVLQATLAGIARPTSSPATPAKAAATKAAVPPPARSAAVVTPLLKLLDFGATFGLPEVCNTGVALLNAGAAEYHLSTQAVPVLAAISLGCKQAQDSGHSWLQMAIARSQALSVFNLFVNPMIAALANATAAAGTQYGPAMAPLGPTVASLALDIAFFEGS